eukprot:804073_1
MAFFQIYTFLLALYVYRTQCKPSKLPNKSTQTSIAIAKYIDQQNDDKWLGLVLNDHGFGKKSDRLACLCGYNYYNITNKRSPFAVANRCFYMFHVLPCGIGEIKIL